MVTEENIDLRVFVECTDKGLDNSFSVVFGYENLGRRINLAHNYLLENPNLFNPTNQILETTSTSRLVPNRPAIHTHFDNQKLGEIDNSNSNLSTEQKEKSIGTNGSITYLKGNILENKAMISEGQGTETLMWKFVLPTNLTGKIKNKEYSLGASRDFANQMIVDSSGKQIRKGKEYTKPTKVEPTNLDIVRKSDIKEILQETISKCKANNSSNGSFSSSSSTSNSAINSKNSSSKNSIISSSDANCSSSSSVSLSQSSSSQVSQISTVKFSFEKVGEKVEQSNKTGSNINSNNQANFRKK